MSDSVSKIKPTRRPYCPKASTQHPTSAPVPTKPAQMPSCEEYFKSRGYDIYFRDGRFVVVKRESRRKRRQDQVWLFQYKTFCCTSCVVCSLGS